MNESITNFYTKNGQSYYDSYDKDHSGRIDWVIKRFKLDEIENKRILDIGCGRGNFFKRLNPNNTFIGLDGAKFGSGGKLCEFQCLRVDFNKEDFGILFDNEEKFDVIIASEVIEHIGNINNIMLQMKKLLKENKYAIFTIPHETVTHPTIFPGIFFPESNFKVFIEQYGWIVEDFDIFQNGWPTCCFKVRNAPLLEARPKFPKSESKFLGRTPEEYTNL